MKRSFYFFTVVISLFSLVSCKKNDSSTPGNYPKQVMITYRVTGAVTGPLTIISYKNETGGTTDVSNPSLPFVKTITKTVNKYDDVTVGYGVNPAQTIKLEILVNNQIVKMQENTAAYGAIAYSFL